MKLFAPSVLLPGGWQRNAVLTIAGNGDIMAIEPDISPRFAERDGAEMLAGPVLPGMANSHSSSFQRCVAGLLETPPVEETQKVRRRTEGEEPDSFWRWRERMYRFAGRLTPDLMKPVMSRIFMDMLKSGYTSVGEFHYLHHRPNGLPWGDSVAMSQAIIDAARETGIGLTLFVTLYQYGGYGKQPLAPEQKGFATENRDFIDLLADVNSRLSGMKDMRLGLGIHSLRAVPPRALNDVVLAVTQHDSHIPIQILAAATAREVEQCVDWCKLRPLEYLLNHAPLGPRWTIVHASQANIQEIRGLLDRQVSVGFCPLTEAGTGFALFPARQFLRRGGYGAIGSGSCLSLSPFEELRTLEFGQRMASGQRGITWEIKKAEKADTGEDSRTFTLGESLWLRMVEGGAKTLNRRIRGLHPGQRADLIVIDTDSPALFDRTEDVLLDSLIFTNPPGAVRDVMAGGQWLVRKGEHRAADQIQAGWRKAIWSLS